jgi:hypothetical protein
LRLIWGLERGNFSDLLLYFFENDKISIGSLRLSPEVILSLSGWISDSINVITNHPTQTTRVPRGCNPVLVQF